MAAYHALSKIAPAMIPTPKRISAGCGMSLRFSAKEEKDAVSLVEGIGQIQGLASLYEESEKDYRLIKVL